MSDQPARLEKLLKDYAAAKTKLQGLQDVASSHALLLNRIVELLRTGGVKGRTWPRTSNLTCQVR